MKCKIMKPALHIALYFALYFAMFGSTNKIKPLSHKSTYYTEYCKSECKGDVAIAVFGKSELDYIKDIWWDSVKKEYLPWRGGTIITNKGTFCWCAYVNWWINNETDPERLFKRLLNGSTIEEENCTIYFWKSYGEDSEPRTSDTPVRKLLRNNNNNK